MEIYQVFAWVSLPLHTRPPSVLIATGHTACLWQSDKILVHGGENEHREYLSDVIVFDIKTATWTQPEVRGPFPRGRARHAAAVHDNKLFVVGGITGPENMTLDDICCLDLRTWTWSRSWTFVPRFDHTAWVWGGRMWVFGGLEPGMEKTGELWWLDLKSSPAFKTAPEYGSNDGSGSTYRSNPGSRLAYGQYPITQSLTSTGPGGYTANTSSVQSRGSAPAVKPSAPGSVSSVKFVYGPNVPSQTTGTHFHCYSSGALLDFVTPTVSMRQSDCNLSALELNGLQWQRLAEGPEIFDPEYRWHYCAINEDGTKAWLLGCPVDAGEGGNGPFEEYLSDIMLIDLKKYGLLGNEASDARIGMGKLQASDRLATPESHGLGADLASMFDRSPDSGTGSDFIVTGEADYTDLDNEPVNSSSSVPGSDSQVTVLSNTPTSRPIHVHKLILQARWPHFGRVYAAQMAEFHTKKMHIPEPYSVVRSFLYYLYTDSIAKNEEFCPTLDEVAGMLVMANIYDMPRLRLLCIHRLSRELDVESAAIVWERASTAGEDWLKRRAATFCLMHWGRLVRTEGFRRLNRQSMMELCEVIDVEGRVVGGEELEEIGGLGGGRVGLASSSRALARRPTYNNREEIMEDADAEDDEGMEMN